MAREVAEVAADIAFLDAVRSIPAADARKVRLPETLGVRPGDAVLEIGPGTGEDLQRFAAGAGPSGLGVGVELVPGIAVEAKRRAVGVPNVAFVVADARRLPFRADAFGAAYAERVLQHVERVEEAVAEIHRVLAAGGRVLIFEPDQELRAVDHRDHETELLLRARAASRYVNPSVGRRLFGLLTRAGFEVARIDGTAAVRTSPDIVEGTAELVADAIADGVMTAEVGDAYLAELERAVTEGTAISIWVAFEAAATKPLTLG